MKAAFLTGNTSLSLRHFDDWSLHLSQEAIEEAGIDLEFKLLAAEVAVVAVDRPSDYRGLHTMACLGKLPLEKRLRALAICAMSADHSFDLATLRLVDHQLKNLKDLSGNDAYGLLARLVCLTVFGDAHEIGAAVDHFLSTCRNHVDFRFRMMGPRWASSAMRRIGDMERRIELVNESMEHALRYRLRHQQLFCWEHLCDTYALLGRLSEAEEALAHLEAASAEGGPLWVAYYASNKAYLAYTTRDSKTAKGLLPVLMQPTPFKATTAVHSWLSSRVAAKLVCAPSLITSNEVEELLSYQREALYLAGYEDRLNIVVEALMVQGQFETAVALMKDYERITAQRLGLGAARQLRRLVRLPPELDCYLE